MTTPNIIIRSCATLIIVLSILLAGGAPSGVGGLRVSDSSIQQCQVELEQGNYGVEIC